MPAALLTHKQSTPSRQAEAPQLPPSLRPGAVKPARTHDIDSLLRQAQAVSPQAAAEAEIELDPRPGIFLGLRVALMFNAGIAVAAMVAYEGWALLAR